MPSSFKMIAALLGDLDNSDGQGKVYFREDNSPDILSRTAEHILQAFPRDKGVEPKNTLIVTWENIAAKGTPGQVAAKVIYVNGFHICTGLYHDTIFGLLVYLSRQGVFISCFILYAN